MERRSELPKCVTMVTTLEKERHIFFTQVITAAFMLDAAVMTVCGPESPSQEVALQFCS